MKIELSSTSENPDMLLDSCVTIESYFLSYTCCALINGRLGCQIKGDPENNRIN